MRNRSSLLVVVVGLGAGAVASGQDLYGAEANGNIIRIDITTGAAVLVGNCGCGGPNALASDASGMLFTIPSPTSLVRIDPATGVGTPHLTLTNQPVGYGVRGMDFDADGVLWVAMSLAETNTPDLLARIDMTSGVYTRVGSMLQTDVQALAIHPTTGEMYATGVIGRLYRVDRATGAATIIGAGGGIVPDEQSLDFSPDGTLYAARSTLKTVDITSGAATLIGPTGFSDIRGIAFSGEAPCYPDCDTSTGRGVLDIFDFLCFQNRYAAGSPYACDCDTSTGAGVCDIFDFLCFQNEFAAGCP
jgi:sugar lactone lactonase YvrE